MMSTQNLFSIPYEELSFFSFPVIVEAGVSSDFFFFTFSNPLFATSFGGVVLLEHAKCQLV